MAWVLNGILRYRSFRLALAFIALTSIYLVAFTLQSDSPVVKIEVLNAQSRAECGLNGLLQAVVRRKRVAIVGAGAGGASAAYHLNLFGCGALDITVFERSDYIGGRSTTVNVYDDPSEPVELGASIFVEVNRILVETAKKFNLSTTGRPDSSVQNYDSDGPVADALGVWNGLKFVVSLKTGNWWDVAKLIWKYGLAPIRTQRLMKKTVGTFLEMYREPYFPFRSLSEVSYTLGLTNVTSMTGYDYLVANGIEAPYSTDIVQASTRVNYAQNLGQIHGLEAMVCMATDGAMQIRGGNWQIFDSMLRDSGAQVLLNTSVISIVKQGDGTYQVNTSSRSAASASQPNTDQTGQKYLQEEAPTAFDTVILAAPLQFSDITLSPEPEYPPDKIDYVNLHVTLLASRHHISPSRFGLPPWSTVPDAILTTLPDNAHNGKSSDAFFSISLLREVLNPDTFIQEHLYKIFSPARLTAGIVAELFDLPDLAITNSTETLDAISESDVSWVYEKSWYSYPYLPPRVTFDDPQLAKDLWYTSGMESFISTMETSALMGRNVAKLVVDDWLVELGFKKGHENLPGDEL